MKTSRSNWSETDIIRLHKEGKILGYEIRGPAKLQYPEKKKSKYGNKKVLVDGIEFDSQKEAFRYQHLKILLSAGLISDLRLQVPYELNPGGTHSLKYVADFVYWQEGKEVVEDSKGYRTKEYRKKRRLMKKVHNITILET